MSRTNSAGGINVQHPKTKSDFERIHKDLIGRGYVAIDVLRKGKVRDINLALSDAANTEASQMASTLGGGKLEQRSAGTCGLELLCLTRPHREARRQERLSAGDRCNN